jgi:transcription termination factor Rho
MRIMDLICPIGKGQRALIVSPPKAGKTTILQDICHAVSKNHPEIDVIVILVDERPEEVTDMLRSVEGDVFASSNDQEHTNHLRIAQLGMQVARRRVETGKDVMVLIDSITRVGRACNLGQPSSGKTMTGGIDSRALEIPRRLFGAARNLENGGSLTVIGTALINTNSRMDDFIYEEFKGTGNSELVLDRDLANRFIYPAVDVVKSGTRKTELLVGDDLPQLHLLRRYLMRLSSPQEAMEALLEGIGKTKTNAELLLSIKENGKNQ